MSLAAETRRSADEHPFLVAALRADVVNFTAAARFLDVDGETDAVATALRRYAAELPEYETAARDVRVTMQSGVGTVEDDAEALLAVGGTRLASGDGGSTAIIATGEVDANALALALETLALSDVSVTAAALEAETMVVVVDRLDGADALRGVEGALESVPSRQDGT